MKTYVLTKEQWINADLPEVWDFFSSPENLDALTPDDMGFQIITKRPIPKMHEGQIIEYKVSPLLGIPMYWKTVIKSVKYQKEFIDVQAKGPYRLWRHTHTFSQHGERVLMKDTIEYALPMGFIGGIARELYVKNRLEDIFAYRFKKVEQLFNKLVVV